MSDPTLGVYIPDSPYPGIDPFGYKDRNVFFARTAEIRSLLRLIVLYRGVLLYSDSGAGKSSLVNAGLLPCALAEGFQAERIRVQPRRGEEIVVQLSEKVGEERISYPSIFSSGGNLERLVLSLQDFEAKLRQHAGQVRPLLVFDQFEEWVTLFEDAGGTDAAKNARGTQEKIGNAICSVVNDTTLPVKVLLSLREDYLAKLTPLFRQCPNLPDQYLQLAPLKAEQVYQAIRGPFVKYPGRFRPELSEPLAKEIRTQFENRGEGADIRLTEVQIVCRSLFEAKGEDPSDVFAKAGGAQGILERYLEQAVGSLATNQREPAVALLSRMVTPAGTRNVISQEDLCWRVGGEDGIARALLDATLESLEQKAKLIRRERRRDVYYYEIASEFLVEWIRKKAGDRQEESRQKKLREAAERERKRAEEQAQLAAAQHELALKAEALAKEQQQRADAERERAGEQARQAKRFRRLSLALGAALLLALAAVFFAFWQRHAARLAANAARTSELTAKGAQARAQADQASALIAEKNAVDALRKKQQSDQKAQSAEARVVKAKRQLAELQTQATHARAEASRAAVEAGKLKDLSALRRFSGLAATNPWYTVAGALASIEAIGRQTSSEAYQSLLESLARLPRRMGAVPWKRTASSRDANVCESYLDTMERVCWPASAAFQSRNYIVLAPDRNSRRSAQPASDLQYWDIWHQSSFQKLNLAVPPRSALSPLGRYLATPEPDALVTIREFPSGKELFRLGSPIREPQSASGAPSFPLYSRAAAIQFSNDERYLITSVVRPGEFDFEHTEFSIWDLEARRRVSWYIGSDRLEFRISPNQKGTRYVWISDGSVCRIPETPTSAKDPGVPLERLFQTPRSPFAVIFSDDGSKLMVTGPFGGLSRGDIQQSSLLYRLPNNTPSVFEHLDSFAVALSPDARLVAFLLGDGLVRVFQTDSQKEVKRIVNEPRGEIKFEDNSHLLTSWDEGALRWGLNDDEALATTGRDSSLVRFSPEGDSIVTGRGRLIVPYESFNDAGPPDQSFSVFDLASTPPSEVFYGQAPRPFRLQFSADSAVLAAQIDDFARVSILPLKEKGAERFISSTTEILEGITPDVRYAAFGERSESEPAFRGWQLLETGKVPPLRAALSNETHSFRGFLGFPDSNTLAGCASGQPYRHDLRDPEWARLSGRDLSVDCDHAGVSADARFVLFRVDSDRPGVALWKTSDGTLTRLPWSLAPLKKSLTLSLKGTFVFIPQLNEIRKVSSGETVFRGPALLPGDSNHSEAVFAPGENLAAGGTYRRTSIVDLGKGGERCSIPLEYATSVIGFDANASHLFASQMGRLTAWRAADCQPENLPNLSGHSADRGIISPDGRFLVSMSSGRQIKRLKDQLQVTSLANHEAFALNTDDAVTATAFSPDGRFLIATSGDGTARTLDRKSRPAYQDAAPPQIFGADVTSIAVSPDGQYAAAAAGASVRMWEIRSGRAIGEAQKSARVPSVSFSHDGKLLAMGESDGRVEVLAVPSLASVKELSLASRLISASFSADGEYLAAASVDGFTIWDSKTWTAVA